MFTLRLIFYGLIAFVPNSQGKGMTALVIDDLNHDAVVALLEGQCTSDKDVCNPNDQRFELFWPLDGDLTLDLTSGSPDLDLSTRPSVRVGFPDPDDVEPDALAATSWVLRMEHISPRCTWIRPRCLRTGCRQVVSRIKVNEGEAGVCHFSHAEDDRGDRVASFFFRSGSTIQGPGRAIGDALLVQIEVEGTEFKLRLGDWEATLKPKNEVVTLIVSNNDYPDVSRLEVGSKNRDLENFVFYRDPRLEGEKELIRTEEHRHFARYYDLSVDESSCGNRARRFKPAFGFEEALNAGSCERDLEKFENKLEVSDGAHSHRECDLVIFSPSADG